MSNHCAAANKRTNKMLGFISRTFIEKAPDITKLLYRTFVKPHLEYAVQFWSLNFTKDLN